WYEVDVENVCGQEHRGFEVLFEDCACDVYLPNSFSPNQDGINDVFSIHTACELQDVKWVIFNRWGEKVFESNSQESVWLGNKNQKEHFVPDGVYFYTLEYSTPKQDRVKVQGHVTVLR
ncbi:MAG: gliding motility-associated C-terminal domain-containing protein, partial [Flavobacteriales bacterium]